MVLFSGMNVAGRIISLKIQAGEGAVLQRLTHALKLLVRGCKYQRLAVNAAEAIGDAKAFQSQVHAFCSEVKNGWSDRTKEQAAYFRGLSQRFVEMAEKTKILIEHKAGINTLIPMDLQRVRQEFRLSYETFINLTYIGTLCLRDGSK